MPMYMHRLSIYNVKHRESRFTKDEKMLGRCILFSFFVKDGR